MVGMGYDCHRLAQSESFILGGVEIDFELGTVAHSDGDALFHALCDALLGAAGLGDIGEHFPDSDPMYKNIVSGKLVEKVVSLLKNKNLKIINIDATIILEKPKLKPYKERIRANMAGLCFLPENRVNIKAKTSEKLGFTGRMEGIEVYCVCEIQDVPAE